MTTNAPGPDSSRLDGFRIDLRRHQVHGAESVTKLTAKEAHVLTCLAARADVVVSRDALARGVGLSAGGGVSGRASDHASATRQDRAQP